LEQCRELVNTKQVAGSSSKRAIVDERGDVRLRRDKRDRQGAEAR
jgi:hypothetical protein